MKKGEIERAKLNEIASLKNKWRTTASATEKKNILLRLVQHYEKYQIDSAIVYVQRYRILGEQLQDNFVVQQSDIYLSKFYSSAGKHIESATILARLQPNLLDKTLLPHYFETYSAFNSHYGQSSNDIEYYKRSEDYRDSLLSSLDTSSQRYRIALATKKLYNYETDEAETILTELLDSIDDSHAERALVAYFLGIVYKNKNDLDKQLYYFTISAIADIKNMVKDNASLQSLALCYYEKGDIDQAYALIQETIDDAVFSNVRYRTIENSSFFSIINAAFQEKETAQKKALQKNLIIISTLSLLLLFALFTLYVRLKKLQRARTELRTANEELTKLNNQLLEVNTALSESNHIKEEYIAQFFDICSNYIDKIDEYRKILFKKFSNKQFDEISRMLKSQTIVKQELDDLYRNFDMIFLNLYPYFIRDFNNLLKPEEQIDLKQGELLNTELRIFALIRLGITDSAKIAGFLRYSLRTVYNYRVKVRSRVAGSKDEFDEKIKTIGEIRTF
ncbi:DUF6377 domain-containing protein [Sphingobacterium wenxiniae]|uniref:DUF6377 domain-containing protein n=1 Tax=Sphingobacterium wenxiniae TaxID=683125 RepID=A0A1I6TZE0_9SPHI|nr:DUF6377 domain-containing protein [Sphingobacterium wenxiniae]SFS94561.1 hypothetical protein SAMN05660206_107156 [Sphingobacterium wenxiniae]